MDSKIYAGERILSTWLALSSTLWNERLVTGMTFNEAYICNLLAHQQQDAPDRPMTATALCEETRLLKSQMNKILSDMDKKGYISRIRSEQDRRQIFITLSETGMQAYQSQHKNITAILSALIDDLGEDTVLKASDSVDQIVASLKKITLP